MAIRVYLTGLTGKAGQETLNAALRNSLSTAVDKVGDCTGSTEQYENAFEVGAFGAARGDPQVRIKDFQNNLRAALAGKSPVTVPTNGILDSDTRKAIAEYRRVTNTLFAGANNPRNRQVDNQLKRNVAP
jgi:hypothetical protein